MRAGVIALLLVGCAHHGPPPLVLNQHESYDAVPGYLRCPAPKVVEVTACPGSTQLVVSRESGGDYSLRPSAPSMTKMQALDRLRALLAVIDAHVAALGEQPTPDEVQALRLSVAELRKLLDAWPDVR